MHLSQGCEQHLGDDGQGNIKTLIPRLCLRDLNLLDERGLVDYHASPIAAVLVTGPKGAPFQSRIRR